MPQKRRPLLTLLRSVANRKAEFFLVPRLRLSLLAQLVKEIEAAEAVYLPPATEQFRHEREKLEERNRSLETLVRRREDLVQRRRTFLAEAHGEQRAMERELSAVLIAKCCDGAPQGIALLNLAEATFACTLSISTPK